MPNLPIFNSPMASRGLEPSSRGIDAVEGEGRAWGAAFRSLGENAQSIGNTIERHYQAEDIERQTAGAADFEIEQQQSWEDAKAQGVKQTDWFENKYLLALDSFQEKMAPDSRAGQLRLDEYAARHKANTFHSTLGDQVTIDGNNAVASLEGSATKFANLAAREPSRVGEYAGQMGFNIDSLAQSHQLGPDHVADIKLKTRQAIYDSAIRSVVSRAANPDATPQQIEAAKALIDSDEWAANTSPGTYVAALNSLDRAKVSTRSIQSEIAAQTFNDGLDQMRANGGLDPKGQWQSIINNLTLRTPDETALRRSEMQRQYDAAKASGEAQQGMWNMPQTSVPQALSYLDEQIKGAAPDQVKSLIAQRKAVADAAQGREQAHKQDPAGWAMTYSPTVQNAYRDFAQKPSPQSFARYAAATSAEQSRIFPNEVPGILPKKTQDRIAKELSGVTSQEGGATQAAGVLQTWAQTTGRYWPQAAQQLFHAKVLNPTQFVAASMFGKPGGVGIAEDLLRAGSMKPGDLAKAAPEGVTEEKARAAANEALAPLAQTLQQSGGGLELIDSYEKGLANLLLLRGTADSGAARTLAARIIMDDYSFHGSLRIPVQAGLNSDDVEAGTKSVLRDLSNHDIVPPRSFSGLGPADQQKAYVGNIRRYGRWVTNPDESGAVLLDEQGHQVFERVPHKDPKMPARIAPVELKWSALAPLGAQYRGIPGKAMKFLKGEQ